MHQRERTDGEIARGEFCWEGVALKMQSYWNRFFDRQLLHAAALHKGAFKRGSLYTGGWLYSQKFYVDTVYFYA